MTGNTSIATAPTQIPYELYRAIANHLHEDKHTLLALALASKAWSAESQRVLFRIVLDEGKDLDSIRYTHELFLNTILRNPILGTYVHTYSQHKLICHPHHGADNPYPHWQIASAMWELTEAALPALVNLKHLCIVPLCDDQTTAPLLKFEGCTFSLRSLVWGFQHFDNRTGPWIEFLRNQHELVHLKIGGIMAAMQNYSWLTDDACPNLTWTTCLLPSRIVHRPAIVGLRTGWFEPGDPDESQVAALRRLPYLSVTADYTVIPALGGTDSNLVLLEISGWRFKKDRLLPGFPKLRVLVFSLLQRRSDVAALEEAKKQMTIESFRKCPMLEYIVMEMEDTPRGDRERYRKLTIPDTVVEGPLDALPDIQNEVFIMEREEQGKPWWTAYGF